MDLDFDRQKVINNRYIVDFYCPQYNLAIEIDGCSHDDKCEYDMERDKYLSELGISVIHIADSDVKTNMEGVLATIKNAIGKLSIPPKFP
jgi:very-short-patch-repair endonuclease